MFVGCGAAVRAGGAAVARGASVARGAAVRVGVKAGACGVRGASVSAGACVFAGACVITGPVVAGAGVCAGRGVSQLTGDGTVGVSVPDGTAVSVFSSLGAIVRSAAASVPTGSSSPDATLMSGTLPALFPSVVIPGVMLHPVMASARTAAVRIKYSSLFIFVTCCS